jgi:hypothetical protein
MLPCIAAGFLCRNLPRNASVSSCPDDRQLFRTPMATSFDWITLPADGLRKNFLRVRTTQP